MSDRNIHQRLAEVMKNVTYVQKDRKEGMKYAIVSHDVVTKKCRGPLLEAGVIYYPVNVVHERSGNLCSLEVTTRFVNIDSPKDCIEVETVGYGVDTQDKGPGKAMSYAIKYALLKALGLETGEDADLDQETEREEAFDQIVANILDDIEDASSITELNKVREDHSKNLGLLPPEHMGVVREAVKAKRIEYEG